MSTTTAADAMVRMARAYLARREGREASKVLDAITACCPGHPDIGALREEIKAVREFLPRPAPVGEGAEIRDAIMGIQLDGFNPAPRHQGGKVSATVNASDGAGQYMWDRQHKRDQAVMDEYRETPVASEPPTELSTNELARDFGHGTGFAPTSDFASLLAAEKEDATHSSTELVLSEAAGTAGRGTVQSAVQLTVKNTTEQTVDVGYRYENNWKPAGSVPPGVAVVVGTTNHGHCWRVVGHDVAHEWIVDQSQGANQQLVVRQKIQPSAVPSLRRRELMRVEARDKEERTAGLQNRGIERIGIHGSPERLSNEELLRSCALYIRAMRLIPADLLTQYRNTVSLGSVEAAVAALMAKYNEATVAIANVREFPGSGAQYAGQFNQKLAEECHHELRSLIDGQPPPQTDMHGMIKPGSRAQTFSAWNPFAARHKLTFYTVNPFIDGHWPAGVKLMIQGSHPYLGDPAETPVYEYARPHVESDDAMLKVAVDLPPPGPADFDNDQFEWFRYRVVLALEDGQFVQSRSDHVVYYYTSGLQQFEFNSAEEQARQLTPITIVRYNSFDFTSLILDSLVDILTSARVFEVPVRSVSIHLLKHEIHLLKNGGNLLHSVRNSKHFSALKERPSDEIDFAEIVEVNSVATSVTDSQIFLLIVAADGIARGGTISEAAMETSMSIIESIRNDHGYVQQLPDAVANMLHGATVQLVDASMHTRNLHWIRTLPSLDMLHRRSSLREREKPILDQCISNHVDDTAFMSEITFLSQSGMLAAPTEKYKFSEYLLLTCPSARSLMELVKLACHCYGQNQESAHQLLTGIFELEKFKPQIFVDLQDNLHILDEICDQIRKIGSSGVLVHVLLEILADLLAILADRGPASPHRFLAALLDFLANNPDVNAHLVCSAVLKRAAFDDVTMVDLAPLLATAYKAGMPLDIEIQREAISAANEAIERRRRSLPQAALVQGVSSLASSAVFLEEPLCTALSYSFGPSVNPLQDLELIRDLHFAQLVAPLRELMHQRAASCISRIAVQPSRQIIETIKLLHSMIVSAQRVADDSMGFEVKVSLLNRLVKTITEQIKEPTQVVSDTVLEIVKTHSLIMGFDAGRAEQICPISDLRELLADLVSEMRTKTLRMRLLLMLLSDRRRPVLKEILDHCHIDSSVIEASLRSKQKVELADARVNAVCLFFNRRQYKQHVDTDLRRILHEHDMLRREWDEKRLQDIEREAVFTQFLKGHEDVLELLVQMEAAPVIFDRLRIQLFDMVVSRWNVDGGTHLCGNVATLIADKPNNYHKLTSFGRSQSESLCQNMSTTFKKDGKLTVVDLFQWLLPCLCMAWEQRRARILTMQIPLSSVSDVLGSLLSTDATSRLSAELLALERAGKPSNKFYSLDRVLLAMEQHSQLSKSMAFTNSLIEQIRKIGGKTRKFTDDSWTEIQKTAETGKQHWETDTLVDATKLTEMFDKVVGSFHADHKRFLDILFDQQSVIDDIRYKIDHRTNYLYMTDDQLFAQFHHRVIDGEYEDGEKEAVDSIGHMRHVYVATVLTPHTSFAGFMKAVGTVVAGGNARPEGGGKTLFEYLETFDRTIRAVDRIYNDVSERSGKKDAKLLMQINTEGIFRCTQPQQIRGTKTRLMQGTLALVVPSTANGRLSLTEAEDLRDRLFLETDDNATDDASKSLSANVHSFHCKLEAIKHYNRVLVEFFLHGHRESGNTYIKDIAVAGTTAAKIDSMREERQLSLKRWEASIAVLRQKYSFLNYYTVHQLMLINDGIKSGHLPESMFRFVKAVHVDRNLSRKMRRSYEAIQPAQDGQALSRQQSVVSIEGLKTIRTVAEFLDQWFTSHQEVSRPFPSEPPADLVRGELNVVVAPAPSQVLSSLLSIYAPLGRLPFAYEIVFCTEWTSLEEVLILLRRCFDRAQSTDEIRRYCLANADKLAHSMQQGIIREFERLHTQEYVASQGYFDLVILCSQGQNLFMDNFRRNGREVPVLPVSVLQQKLATCFGKTWSRTQNYPFVKVFYSKSVGVGKTFQIMREAEAGYRSLGIAAQVKSVPITAHCRDADALIRGIQRPESHVDGEPCAFHLDISGNVQPVVDILIFQLLVMMNLVDSNGMHHEARSADAFFIELPSDDVITAGGVPIKDRLNFCFLLPGIEVDMTRPPEQTRPYNFLLDNSKDEVRLVCQYLRAMQQGDLMCNDRLAGFGSICKESLGWVAAEWTDMTSQVVKTWNHLPHMSQQECYDVLRYVSPRGLHYAPEVPSYENGRYVKKCVLDVSMILTMNYIRYLFGFLHLIDAQVMHVSVGSLAHPALRALGKPDFKVKMIENMMMLSADVSGRSISPKSLLPEQAKAMGLEVTDKHASLGHMEEWASRPLILPVAGGGRGFQLLSLNPEKVPQHVKTYWQEGYPAALVAAVKKSNGKLFTFEDYRSADQDTLRNLLCDRLGVSTWKKGDLKPTDVSEDESPILLKYGSFVLTIDNIFKMNAIHSRLRSSIPVLIMGETGCGKTFSIGYLAAFLGVPFYKLDVHGGITESDVLAFMTIMHDGSKTKPSRESPISKAATASEVWVFLDEINTCDCLGLFKEMICDGTMNGEKLPPNLKVLAACNPYRLKPAAMQRSGGLTHAGGIGRSDLVYVVNPLPETLLDYVWDYGTLNLAEEKRYIGSMLRLQFDNMQTKEETRIQIDDLDSFVETFANMVVEAHQFLRAANGGEVSVVSLRDVSRCIKLFSWFFHANERLRLVVDSSVVRARAFNLKVVTPSLLDRAIEAMVLALAHCYHFRLEEDSPTSSRGVFRDSMASVLSSSAGNLGSQIRFSGEWFAGVIDKVSDWFITAMGDLPAGIAPNQALKENVFMMVVCIMNKIPLIVVGKPGSSKSLAMTLIRTAFTRSTKSDKYNEAKFDDMQMYIYQCSKASTADQIEETFKIAKRVQDSDPRGTGSPWRALTPGGTPEPTVGSTSVVFLDEVGLAEESEAFPLKVLHKLLEKPEVAFVGLSNWDLDPAKMNRAVFLLRPEQKPDDLAETGIAIVTSKPGNKNSNVEESVELIMAMDSLTKAYNELAQRQTERGYCLRGGGHFIGLRDYFQFCKLLDRSIERERERKLRDGVGMYGGTEELSAQMLVDCIARSFGGFRYEDQIEIIWTPFYNNCKHLLAQSYDTPAALEDSVHVLDMICGNLVDLPTDDRSGARHLMVLSDHESALQVLKDKNILDMQKTTVLYGSNFPGDKSVLAMYSTINKVKNCMEAGHTVVLMHLDEIYESLYDMLNQHYSKGVGDGLFCRLAVGAQSRTCEVHPKFRCILIVDTDTAYTQLPSPLLNRFEKQCLSRADVLDPLYAEAEVLIWQWCIKILQMRHVIHGDPKKEDLCKLMQSVFVGFNSETIASMLLSIQERPDAAVTDQSQIVRTVQEMLTWLATAESVVKYSFCTGSGLLGSDGHQFDMARVYFGDQQHRSLCDFIHFALQDPCIQEFDSDKPETWTGVHAVVMTFSGTDVDLANRPHLVHAGLSDPIMPLVENLQNFHSGADFRQAVMAFYKGSGANTFLVHCTFPEVTSAQIHHAKLMCIECIEEYRQKKVAVPMRKNVIFLVHLCKDDRPEGVLHSFTFHTERDWLYATIDSIEDPDVQKIPDVQTTLTFNFAQLFSAREWVPMAKNILKSSFRKCLSKLAYPRDFKLSVRQHMLMLERLFDEDEEFVAAVFSRLRQVFEPSSASFLADNWQAKLTNEDICGSGTFRKALYRRVELSVHQSFTRVLAALDQCANLSLYDSLENVSLRKMWIVCLRNPLVEIPNFAPGEARLSLPAPNHSRAFKAAFPFSVLIYERIEEMRPSAKSLTQDDPVQDEWSVLARLVDSSSLAFCIKHVDELDRYVTDVVRIKHLALSMGQWNSESDAAQARKLKYQNAYLSVSRAFVIRRAMDKTGRSSRDCLYHVAYVNMAFSECEEMLTHTLNLMQLLPEKFLDSVVEQIGILLESPGRNGQLQLVHWVLKVALEVLSPEQSLSNQTNRVQNPTDRSWGEWVVSFFSAEEQAQVQTGLIGTAQNSYSDFCTHIRMVKRDLQGMFAWCARSLGYASHDDIAAPKATDTEVIRSCAKILLGDLDDIVKEGWLTKQGHTFRNWKRRWCVLSRYDGVPFLHYYIDNDDDDESPSGMIPLQNASCCASKNLRYTFEVRAEASAYNHDFYLFKASTQADSDEWMAAIKSVAQSSLEVSQAAAEKLKAVCSLLLGDPHHPESGKPLQEDRTYKLRTFLKCFEGRGLVDFFVAEELITWCSTRQQATQIGADLVRQGILRSCFNAADASFHDECIPYNLVVSEDGRNIECKRIASEIAQLKALWERCQLVSSLVRAVLQPLECDSSKAQEFWKLVTGQTYFNPVNQFSDTMKFLNNLTVPFDVTGDRTALLLSKQNAAMQFVEHYIRHSCFAVETPRLSFLRFAMNLVAYDSCRKYQDQTDQVLRGLSSCGLSSGMRIWMTGAILQLRTPRVGCPIDALLESSLQTIYDESGFIDNSLSAMIVYIFEDQLLDQLDTEGDMTVLVEHGRTALDVIRRGVQPTASGTAFSVLGWLSSIATIRVVLSTVAEKIIAKEHNATADLCRISSDILRHQGDQSRAIQLYFLKCFEKRVGLQQSFALMMDESLGVPGNPLEMVALRDEILMFKAGSSCQPAADPIEFLLQREQYSIFSGALQQSIVRGKGQMDALTSAWLHVQNGSERAPAVFALATFHSLYSTYGGKDSHTIASEMDWIGKIMDHHGPNSVAELVQKMSTNSFHSPSIFCLQSTSTLDDIFMIRPVIHMAVYALGRNTLFKKLLVEPGTMRQLLLPTMPEDILAMILKTQGDVGIYKCENGHPYLVGQCTRTQQAALCPCGAPIGNAKGKAGHTMAKGNHFLGWGAQSRARTTGKFANMMVNAQGIKVDIKEEAKKGGKSGIYEGNAQTGYACDDYTTQSDEMDSVRELTPVTFRTLRFFMHGMLELASAVNFSHRSRSSLAGLKSVGPSFYSDHVRNDFEQLKKLLGHNAEDLSLFLHLVIQQCFNSPEQEGLLFNDDNSRLIFEKWFKRRVTEVETHFETQCRAIKVGSQEQRSQRTNLVKEITETYPRELIKPNAHLPLLLRTRKRVSVALMVADFQSDIAVQMQHPIIKAFVEPDHDCSHADLTALHHFYNIYQWQTLVYNRYNRRIGRAEARRCTVRQAIAELPQEHRAEWRDAWSKHVKAWNAIQPFIKNYECHAHTLPKLYGDFQGVAIETEGVTDDLDMPIDLGMPNNSKDEWTNSIEPVILQQYAIRVTNSVVESCKTAIVSRAEVVGANLRRSLSTSADAAGRIMQRAAPRAIFMLRQSEFIHYNPDVLELFLQAHAGQSLEYGKGMRLQWDWSAIEEWILENVIEGVPLLQEGVRLFEFKGEVEDARGLSNMVSNIEQEPLQDSVQHLIIKQQGSLHKMGRLYERLQECIGFLRSTGGNGEELLATYAQRTLQLEDSEMEDLYAADKTPGVVVSSVRLKNLIALEKLLTRRIKCDADPFAKLAAIYQEPLTESVANAIVTSAPHMDISKIVSVWEMVVAEYLDNFAMDVPPDTPISAYLESYDNQSYWLDEFEWWKYFPGSTSNESGVPPITLRHCSTALTLYKKLAGESGGIGGQTAQHSNSTVIDGTLTWEPQSES